MSKQRQSGIASLQRIVKRIIILDTLLFHSTPICAGRNTQVLTGGAAARRMRLISHLCR